LIPVRPSVRYFMLLLPELAGERLAPLQCRTMS
jgi:hypothetical protein